MCQPPGAGAGPGHSAQHACSVSLSTRETSQALSSCFRFQGKTHTTEGVRNALTAKVPAAFGEDIAQYQWEDGDQRMWPGFLGHSIGGSEVFQNTTGMPFALI